MTTKNLFSQLESRIENHQEKAYFHTHYIRYQKTIETVERISGGRKLTILDIGCFPYHIGWMLEQMGHTVYGIAAEHEPVNKKNVSILNIENEKLPFKDNMFDLILCNEVIEHLPNSPVFVLKESRRVSKTDAFIMITTPNVVRLINRIKLLFGKSIGFGLDVYFEEEGKGNNVYHRHNREYTLSELCVFLQNTNWKIEERGYFISYTPFRKRLSQQSILIKLLKAIYYSIMISTAPFGDTLYILGRK